jgi:YD repeat-containing protein
MSLRRLSLFLLSIAALVCPAANAQTGDTSSNDAVRVTVTVNADGSRTTYQYDNAKHEAIATTADANGNALGKAIYRLDDAGRFGSGVVFGPDKKFLFKTLYKYDAGGRLEQETRLARDDSVLNKIVYQYDPAGKEVGCSIFDASGKLISSSPAPSQPSKSHNPHGR